MDYKKKYIKYKLKYIKNKNIFGVMSPGDFNFNRLKLKSPPIRHSPPIRGNMSRRSSRRKRSSMYRDASPSLNPEQTSNNRSRSRSNSDSRSSSSSSSNQREYFKPISEPSRIPPPIATGVDEGLRLQPEVVSRPKAVSQNSNKYSSTLKEMMDGIGKND